MKPRYRVRHSTYLHDRSSSFDTTTTLSDLFAEEEVEEIKLEDEISGMELNVFSRWIVDMCEKPSSLDQEPKLLKRTLSQKLKSYVELKRDCLRAVSEKLNHQEYAREMVKSAEAVLANPQVPQADKLRLQELALKYVEKTMLLKMRVDQLCRRIAYLDVAIPRYLVTYGKRLGLEKQQILQAKLKAKAVLEVL